MGDIVVVVVLLCIVRQYIFMFLRFHVMQFHVQHFEHPHQNRQGSQGGVTLYLKGVGGF